MDPWIYPPFPQRKCVTQAWIFWLFFILSRFVQGGPQAGAETRSKGDPDISYAAA